MYNKYFSRSFIFGFVLFVRLLVYRGLENIDGYTFSRGEVNVIYKYIFNVL